MPLVGSRIILLVCVYIMIFMTMYQNVYICIIKGSLVEKLPIYGRDCRVKK